MGEASEEEVVQVGGRGGGEDVMMMTRKGPWMAEEDEILMDYVRRHGPRDWSSIRSKGLLPRTGKSCRLRWVNKLKPDLKTGCKFSAEEERIVIELQARFGNKWARIATHLPGRTDNDVKNFWSTRQKRLARILRAPIMVPAAKSSSRNQEILPVDSRQLPSIKNANMDVPRFDAESPNSQCSGIFSYTEDHDVTKMLIQMPADLTSQKLLDLEPAMECSLPPQQQQQQVVPFDDIVLDLPLLIEGTELIPGLKEVRMPFFGGQMREDERLVTPDSFFTEFPDDMFEYMGPPSTSSAAW